jgi:hypothetical protein
VFLIFLFYFQARTFGLAKELILSLTAMLPSDGVTSTPPEVFEDSLHLKNLGHFGRSPRNISNDIMEGVRFYEYKKPFYYNKRPTAQDPNPGDDGTLGSYNDIVTAGRRRRDTSTARAPYVSISQGRRRNKRMVFQAFSLALSVASNIRTSRRLTRIEDELSGVSHLLNQNQFQFQKNSTTPLFKIFLRKFPFVFFLNCITVILFYMVLYLFCFVLPPFYILL